jgi:membrane-associated phospholipid phosphatase
VAKAPLKFLARVRLAILGVRTGHPKALLAAFRDVERVRRGVPLIQELTVKRSHLDAESHRRSFSFPDGHSAHSLRLGFGFGRLHPEAGFQPTKTYPGFAEECQRKSILDRAELHDGLR